MVKKQHTATNERGWLQRFLKTVEWLGNLLPHPVTLFAFFVVSILIFSGIAAYFDLSIIDPRPEDSRGRSPDGIVRAISLLNGEGLRRIVEGLVPNFTSFAPLGTVLVAMLGVGVAEASGLLKTGIRSLVLLAPKNMITSTLVFAGVLSNIASDMGYVVLVPIGGYTFQALGRHPLAGMAATFAGVSGGYSANLLIGTLDPLLAGITQESARLIAPAYEVHAAANWYFMAASTFLITIVGTWVSSKIVEPNLGVFESGFGEHKGLSTEDYLRPITTTEKKAMKHAFFALLAVCFLMALVVVPSGGALRNPVTGGVLSSPFLNGIVSLIFVFFFVPAVVYGFSVGSFKSDRDVIKGMSDAMSSLGMYIVLVFFAAQFVAYFNWTNLGVIVAVSGAEFLKDTGLTGSLIFFPFILVCGFINLMLGSASAQWSVTAPIFVPMLMLLGYSPELIQAAYRIGDSTTNIITPLMSYFGIILAFAHRFDKRIGVGTIMSTMLPFSVFFMTTWSVFLYVWVFVLGLPLGPGVSAYYP